MYMLIVCSFIADGTCAIEITEPTQGIGDMSSGFEIARAAWAVVTSCVGDFKHEGGIAENLGKLPISFILFLDSFSNYA